MISDGWTFEREALRKFAVQDGSFSGTDGFACQYGGYYSKIFPTAFDGCKVNSFGEAKYSDTVFLQYSSTEDSAQKCDVYDTWPANRLAIAEYLLNCTTDTSDPALRRIALTI